MLMEYDGPLDSVKFIRESIQNIQGVLGKELLNFDCFFCFSTVVAIPFATFSPNFILYWFALSGIALLINAIYERLER